VSGVKSIRFGVVVFKGRIFRNDGVDWSGVLFLREKFSSFGILGYKYRFQNRGRVTCFIYESFAFRGLVCASYCTTSSQIQPTSSRKNENRYV